MKIYFSGSIRGGRNHRQVYMQMIEELKNYGEVLTEHIGHEQLAESKSNKEIHDQDMNWLVESDIVIAEVTRPSLGVGYEIGRAIHLEKPIHCFYQSDMKDQVSAMILGSNKLITHSYDNLDQILKAIAQIFE